MIFFYKATHNLVSLNGSVLPVSVLHEPRATLTLSSNLFLKNAKLLLIEKPFFIRACRILNILASIINIETQTLNSFKTLIFNCYLTSLLIPYDLNNPKTFKSIYLKCNTVRPLNSKIACCLKIDSFFLLHRFSSYFLLYSGLAVIGYVVAVSLPFLSFLSFFFFLFFFFFFFHLFILIVVVWRSS